jgi:hypothetical protein
MTRADWCQSFRRLAPKMRNPNLKKGLTAIGSPPIIGPLSQKNVDSRNH